MSTIEGMSQRMFAMECDDIIIRTSGVEKVRVRVLVSIPGTGVVFDNTSAYQAVNGMVSVGELGSLCNRCIRLGHAFESLETEQGRNAECTLTIELPDEQVSSTSTVLYCRKTVSGVEPETVCFMTTARDRCVSMSQQLTLYIPGNRGLNVQHKLAYQNGSTVVYEGDGDLIPAGQDTYHAVDASPSIEQTFIPEGAVLLFYDVELYDGDTLCDRVHVDIVTEFHPRQTEMIYLNLFGVQDSLMLRGDDEEEQQYEAQFDYHGSCYQRYDAQLTESHESTSGWVNSDEWKMLCDMLESSAVAVRTSSSVTPVVITSVEAKRVRPTDETDAMTVTWRPADRKAMRRESIQPDTVVQGVFEHPVFDESFE